MTRDNVPSREERTIINWRRQVRLEWESSEPEAAQTPFRDMPMRQGEIRGTRSADSDLRLLLYELPRSRTPVRAIDVRAARARSRQWNRLYPISEGSSAMRNGAGVSRRASAQA